MKKRSTGFGADGLHTTNRFKYSQACRKFVYTNPDLGDSHLSFTGLVIKIVCSHALTFDRH